MDDTKITGRCLCGAVKYAASEPVAARRLCWCRDCQYLACGNAAAGIIVETAQLHVYGRLSEYRSDADSGRHMVRSFCPNCGTQVLSRAEENLDYVVIRAGTLDDSALAAPEGVIWTGSAPRWATIDQGLPHTVAQPTATPWPPRQVVPIKSGRSVLWFTQRRRHDHAFQMARAVLSDQLIDAPERRQRRASSRVAWSADHRFCLARTRVPLGGFP